MRINDSIYISIRRKCYIIYDLIMLHVLNDVGTKTFSKEGIDQIYQTLQKLQITFHQAALDII